MRRKRMLFIGALGLIAALAVSGVAISAPANQTLDVKVTKKTKPKLDKKKFKGTPIEVTTTTSDQANPSGIPPKANRAVLVFDKKNMKFDPKAAPGCDPNQIENTTTAAAKAACGSAQVGDGDAIAALPFGPGGTRQDFPAVVTAFNDGTQSGILLHSRVDQLGTTVVLKGSLRGTTLDVTVPPLGGGVGAIAQFHTVVEEGKYVQVRCKRKTITTNSTFSFNDAPDANASDTQKCKQKRRRR
jgi:hypothetical protein